MSKEHMGSSIDDFLREEGIFEEAQAQATRAVTVLRPMAHGPDAELADAYLTLGDSLRLGVAYDDAMDAFKQARTAAAGPDATAQTLEAEIGLAQVAMVAQPDLAATTLDSILADQAVFKAQPREWQAQVYSLRARAELNRGYPQKALPFTETALTLEGSLAAGKISLYQVGVRGDAALVYSLLHQDEKTRKYLAYAGAGHLPNEGDHFSTFRPAVATADSGTSSPYRRKSSPRNRAANCCATGSRGS